MQNKTNRPGPAPDRPVSSPAVEETQKRQPSVAGRVIRRAGLALLLILALIFAYLFLLLGEPDEEAKSVQKPVEEIITMPMSAVDMPGESDGQKLADTFGQPVLVLGQALTMHKARIYDTALEGGYARCVAITYAFEDGAQLLVQSMRPTRAVTLLQQNGYRLDASALYTMGGLNAARMQNDTSVCVFAQSDTAVYAVICPVSHAEELSGLLRYTALVPPSTNE